MNIYLHVYLYQTFEIVTTIQFAGYLSLVSCRILPFFSSFFIIFHILWNSVSFKKKQNNKIEFVFLLFVMFFDHLSVRLIFNSYLIYVGQIIIKSSIEWEKQMIFRRYASVMFVPLRLNNIKLYFKL